MPHQPHLRLTDDGTYEMLVPVGSRMHILPYCFRSRGDADRWLQTGKAKRVIAELTATFVRKQRSPHRERQRVSAEAVASSQL
jgi:hypothetical protein